MKTFFLIYKLIVQIVWTIIVLLGILSVLNLKVLIVPIQYKEQNIDKMIRLIEHYRMYYIYSDNYIRELEYTKSTNSTNNCINSLRDYYNQYKDSVIWDNEYYSTNVEYVYPKNN